MLRSISVHDQVSACDALSLAALSDAQIDISTVQVLLDELMRQESKDGAQAMVRALTVVLYSNPELPQAIADDLDKLFQDTLNGKLTCLTQPGQAELDILPPLFSLFVFATAVFGRSWAELAPVYQSRFVQQLNSKSRAVKSHAILGLAALAAAIGEPELMQLAVANAVQAINFVQTIVRTNAFSALNILVKVQPEALAPHVAAIRGALAPAIATVDHSALWCSCVVAFEWAVEPAEAVSMLSNLEVQCGEDLGRSIDFARFVIAVGASLGPCSSRRRSESRCAHSPAQLPSLRELATKRYRPSVRSFWTRRTRSANFCRSSRSISASRPDWPSRGKPVQCHVDECDVLKCQRLAI
jgi:hypothetical protein